MADQPPRQPPSRQNQTRLIVALVVAVFIVVFALQNRHRTRVSFLFLHWDGRVVYVILVSAIAGAIATWLVQRARRSRRERRGDRPRE
jgi:uncharacterized integral membrane protein